MTRQALRILAVSVLICASATASFARDDQKNYSIQQALTTAEAKEKLHPSIRLFFGNQPHAAAGANLGKGKTNKKSNGFGRSDKDACQHVFLSAMLALQERAEKLGGNAVINIKSNYENRVVSSNSEYVCGSGGLMSGVAFIGDIVTIGGKKK